MTYIHAYTDRIAAFVTKEGLASLAPIMSVFVYDASVPCSVSTRVSGVESGLSHQLKLSQGN